MADVTIKDTATPGEIGVNQGTTSVSVVGNRLYIEIIDGTSTVTVKGTDFSDTNLFLRVRLKWNGTTNEPDILDVAPPGFDVDTYFNIQNNELNNPEDWAIYWEYGANQPATSLTVTNIVGTSFNQVSYVSWDNASPKSTYRFVMKLNGTPVYPAANDECTLTILVAP